jgi:tRNA(Ile2) C34 agmatinyltransferase TiaS
MTDRWRYACPECDSTSITPTDDGYRCKQCYTTFSKRYDKQLDRLV